MMLKTLRPLCRTGVDGKAKTAAKSSGAELTKPPGS